MTRSLLKLGAFVFTLGLFLALDASIAGAVCGDGVIDPGEGCDDAAANGPPPACCSTACQCNVGAGCGVACFGTPIFCNYSGGPPSSCGCRSVTPPPLDHYRVYDAAGPPPDPDGLAVQLRDQFLTEIVPVGPVILFMVPADKNGEGIRDPYPHLTCYDTPVATPFSEAVMVHNQFGPQTLAVSEPFSLCVPTHKFPLPPLPPLARDHYRCYGVAGSPPSVAVSLADQFQQAVVGVLDPVFLCNPVDKNEEGIQNPFDHLVCYQTTPPGPPVGPIPIENQFGPEAIDVLSPNFLCVPSSKEVL